MTKHKQFHFKGVPGTYDADPKGVQTTVYEFNTEEEMNASGLLNDPRRTTCFTSDGKYYIGGHFYPPKMKKVYICSRYRADERYTTGENIASAVDACKYAALKGCAPYAPHLYLPLVLDDSDPTGRVTGMSVGLEFLKVCDEVWQWGTNISEGMAAELKLAKELGIPVIVFYKYPNDTD